MQRKGPLKKYRQLKIGPHAAETGGCPHAATLGGIPLQGYLAHKKLPLLLSSLELYTKSMSLKHELDSAETGGCPHAAIREDISGNLVKLEELTEKFHPEANSSPGLTHVHLEGSACRQS